MLSVSAMNNDNLQNAERGGEFTAQPLAASTTNGADDDWLRLPRPKQRLWGLSRTTWIELIESGEVRGISLRKKNAQRGIRLIYRPSATAHLMSLMNRELPQR